MELNELLTTLCPAPAPPEIRAGADLPRLPIKSLDEAPGRFSLCELAIKDDHPHVSDARAQADIYFQI